MLYKMSSPAGSACGTGTEQIQNNNSRFRDMTHCYPNDPITCCHQSEDISGPQYVVIRITSDKVLECRNTLNKYRAVIENYGGKVVGLGEKMLFLEENLRKWRHNHSIVLLWFETRDQTLLWWQSMPDVKQQDWLGDSVDVVIIPARTQASAAPPCGTGSVLLSDIHFVDPVHMENPYRPDYEGPVSDKMRDAGVLVGLTSTAKTDKKRGSWEPNFVTLHHFPCQQQLIDFYKSDDYAEAIKERQTVSSSDLIFCDLKKL